MKIALVHYAYAPVVGGVERVMEEQARIFRKHGHEVTVLCQRGGGEENRHFILLPGDASALSLKMRGVLAGMDVVLVHNVMTMPFHEGLTLALVALAAELRHVRFFGWVHDVAARNPDLPAPEWICKAYPGFEYVAVSSLRSRQWAEVSGLESRVIPNGVDAARVLGLPGALAELAERRSLLDGRILLLHPTRLLRRKNVETSIRAAAEIAKNQPVTLLVTGAADPHNPASASYADFLRDECTRLDADVIFMADHLSVGDAELAGLYRMADALIFPSRQEGFGLPLLEAALHRLPVICSDVEPLPELAGEEASFISPDCPSEAVAKIIQDLLRGSARQNRLRVLSVFTWESIYSTHLAPLLQRL